MNNASYDRAARVLAGGALGAFRLPPEAAFAIAGGQGAEIWDRQGNRYLDYLMSSGPMVLGHAHPAVAEAIAAQAGQGTSFYYVNELSIELAERIIELVPCAQRVRFCSDGSEATFYALRLARAFTGRSRILKFDESFHGHHDYAQQRPSSRGSNNFYQSEAENAGIPAAISDSVCIAPYNDLEATRAVAHAHRHELAAILVEPIQRCILPEPGFLAGLRELADEIGAILIFDEVVTGFRVSLGGAQELYGVTPDLCALGKALGGGTPLAAVAGRAEILELADFNRQGNGRLVYMSGTLNGNPLSCAAGLATLRVIEESRVPKLLNERGQHIADEIRAIGTALSVNVQTLGSPAFPQIVFDAPSVTKPADLRSANVKAAQFFGSQLLKRGIFVWPGSKIYLSSAHDDRCQSRFLEAAEAAIRATRDRGLLNGN